MFRCVCATCSRTDCPLHSNLQTGTLTHTHTHTHTHTRALKQNEIRSLVSLGDGAAGGGSVPSGSSGSGGESSKRPSTSRVVPNPKRKKENPSGPVLYDSDTDWWGGKMVSRTVGTGVEATCCVHL